MPVFHTSFKFDTVVLLDSLPPGEDPQTAVWLRDVVLKPLQDARGFRLWYHRVEDRKELLAALGHVAAAVREAGIGPILHLETHGSERGVVLANGEELPWPSLKPWLTDINRACRMNLLTVMSMCHGWHWVSQLQPIEQSPVWALIGPVPEVLPSRLQEAFQAFYPELLARLDARAAIAAMNGWQGRNCPRADH